MIRWGTRDEVVPGYGGVGTRMSGVRRDPGYEGIRSTKGSGVRGGPGYEGVRGTRDEGIWGVRGMKVIWLYRVYNIYYIESMPAYPGYSYPFCTPESRSTMHFGVASLDMNELCCKF